MITSDRETLRRIGRNLAAERARRGHTQERLAELSQVSVAHVARMERGEVDAGVLKYVHIARALDVPLSVLFQGA